MITLMFLFFISIGFAEQDYHFKDKDFNMVFTSSKVDDLRTFSGSINRTYKNTQEEILNGIISYEKRCNNDLRKKRVIIDRKYVCPFYHKSTVESQAVKQISLKPNQDFILHRTLYSGGSKLTYYDRVKVTKNKSTIIVTQDLLKSPQIKELLGKSISDSDYLKSVHQEFIIKTVEGGVKLSMKYLTTTDHWMMNKYFVVSKFQEGLMSFFTDFMDKEFKRIK